MSVYNSLAPSFDRQRALPDGVPAAIRDALLGSLAATRPRLLDLGCGSGRIGAAFVAKGDDYVGVDLSLGMLRAFQIRHGEAPVTRLLLLQGNGEHLPFRDAAFDAVLLMQVLNAATGWRALLSEATRIVRQGGALVVGGTVAPDDGIDARMKRHLAAALDAMGVPPYRPQTTDAALAMLANAAGPGRTIVAAQWSADRTPRRFLERHGAGARFAVLPAPMREVAVRQVGDSAAATYGSLDTVFTETFHYALTIFTPMSGKPH